ncbi:carbamoyl-phosphate synthase large subunit [Methanolobus bombayensis]|uniref:carbamoyl-phosphate synthase large subunit n=1 Tax=Methanolobus bombayensis TaxID=38023 RepID=UPI001AE155A4|nr:carbamoyl-phosphate synthase large subunit [Methanolobus bombayensis]MBP1908941.1 carbamoyl-phosphate synthase large subunit [Methanolobus bombayensis]
MPKRNDLKKIMIVGAGPIVIGQACEFDYSGSQACKALKEEGYEVILVNSNPATIMTDPELSDRTYIEPLSFEILTKIIEKERPCAILPTLGGQTALNLVSELAEANVLEKYGVELIGANLEAIKKAEDRLEFKEALQKIGVPVPGSAIASSVDDAVLIAEDLGYPVIIRPAYTLGGSGGGIAHNVEELKSIAELGIKYSRIDQVLIEESVLGWKEYELEVMRDSDDNVVIICSIENLDPMGVHTGDSITVAPTQTLSDHEYQLLRDASLKIIREIGVDTGGSNIQFAVNPADGRFVAIEMNPRVSRSSALASKATGFPIAKIAAKLAVGMTLPEIPNDITRETPASFEPTIDYVVVKIPKFAFEKFPGSDEVLTTQMKSVGEVMAIGRTFEEALQKAVRSLETNAYGLFVDKFEKLSLEELTKYLPVPNSERLFCIASALKKGMNVNQIAEITGIDPWFLHKIKNIAEMEEKLSSYTRQKLPIQILKNAKIMGFSDMRIGQLLNSGEKDIRTLRKESGLFPSYKMVDTCAAEFGAMTPYMYSTYEESDDIKPSRNESKIAIIGSGPNRIGQGIEFDYCCVHACYALRELGIETVMINCNPETVSTDYDTSDYLYFEPLTLEDILNVLEREKVRGVIIQFGGQTPLNLAKGLEDNGIPIIGTSLNSIDITEDREKFSSITSKLNIPTPSHGMASTIKKAMHIAGKIGYPVMIRPSYVLGGQSMEIVRDNEHLNSSLEKHFAKAEKAQILVDKYLENSIEVDVDAICDGQDVYIAGILEHIEEAGIHSGDSACVIPPQSLSQEVINTIKQYTRDISLELNVIGLINIQYVVCDEGVYILEANPRASRTVPFVSKVTGLPIAKIATKVMAGAYLKDFGLFEKELSHVAVKESVFPFIKLKGSDSLLGPEMKSTGEVMGVDSSLEMAYCKAQLAANSTLPAEGTIFVSVEESELLRILPEIRQLQELKFKIVSDARVSTIMEEYGLHIPNILNDENDKLMYSDIDLMVNTINNHDPESDDKAIRLTAIEFNVPYITTIPGFKMAVRTIIEMKNQVFDVRPLQELEKNKLTIINNLLDKGEEV